MRVILKWKIGAMVLAVVVLVLCGVVAWQSSRGTTSGAAVQPIVVVAGGSGATGGVRDEPPVYPKRDPEYPVRGAHQDFQQVGVLVGKRGDAPGTEPVVLPLFGRKVQERHDRWEYYVATDQNHMWKLPIQQKNRMCDDDVGCEEIYQGDEIVVPDYENIQFTARIYKYAKLTRQ